MNDSFQENSQKHEVKMTPQSFVVFVLVVRTAYSQINALASVLEFANSPDSDSEHVTSQVLERPIESKFGVIVMRGKFTYIRILTVGVCQSSGLLKNILY